MEFTLRNRSGQIEVFHVLIILIVTNPRSRHLLSYYDKYWAIMINPSKKFYKETLFV